MLLEFVTLHREVFNLQRYLLMFAVRQIDGDLVHVLESPRAMRVVVTDVVDRVESHGITLTRLVEQTSRIFRSGENILHARYLEPLACSQLTVNVQRWLVLQNGFEQLVGLLSR